MNNPKVRDFCSFSPSKEVHEIGKLIGRNKPDRELQKLLRSVINSNCNPQVIAERRSGKSSLLNCAFHEISNCHKTFLPILINFKKYNYIAGVQEGYLLISSLILDAAKNLSIWTASNKIEIGRKTIFKKESWPEYYQSLQGVGFSAEKLFSDLIIKFSRHGISVILLIDEYESMFFSCFKGQLGSVHCIRDIIMGKLENEQVLKCIITGARPWHVYHQDVGSDDFNFIDDTIYLKPFSYEESYSLFQSEVEKCTGIFKGNISEWENHIQWIHELAGGWPYLTKIIGNEYAQTGHIDEATLLDRLETHFSNIQKRLPEGYTSVLLGQQLTYQIQEQLIKWGLAKRKYGDITQVEPNGMLWRKFLQNQDDPKNDVNNFSPNDVEGYRKAVIHYEISQLASDVVEHITEINEVLRGKDKPIIFDTSLSISYPQYFNKLGILADNLEHFRNFISSLYIILYESTQKHHEGKLRNLYSIPAEFNKQPKDHSPDVFHHIDALRHKFLKAHDTTSKNFHSRRFTPEQSQEHFLGHRNSPKNDDFYIIQKGLLTEFSEFLDRLLSWAYSQQV